MAFLGHKPKEGSLPERSPHWLAASEQDYESPSYSLPLHLRDLVSSCCNSTPPSSWSLKIPLFLIFKHRGGQC